MKYISSLRYLPGEADSVDARKLRSNEANAQSRAAAPKLRKDFERQQLLEVVTLRNIKIREKLIVDYGVKYSLQYLSSRGLYQKNEIKHRNVGLHEN